MILSKYTPPVFASLLLSAQLTFAGSGQAQDMSSLWGVWSGRLGDVEIRFCAQSDPGRPLRGDFAAIYTTLNYDIKLLDRQSNATLSHRLARTEIVRIDVLEDGSVRLEGSASDPWSGVALSPLTVEADRTPCVSDAFNAPRTFLPRPVITPAELDGRAYEVVSIIDPSGNGQVTTFRLRGDGTGATAINARLTEALPQTAEEAPYYSCTLDALQVGARSFWGHRIKPEWITDRFIVIEDVEDVFCGGAHPSYSVEWYVLDMETGEEIDTRNWIREDAFYELGPYGGQNPEVADPEVASGFRQLMIKAFDATNPDPSCHDLLDIVETWNVRPSRNGVVLTPSDDLSSARSCAVGLYLSIDSITPYLTDLAVVAQGL